MATTTTTRKAEMDQNRYDDLKQMLEDRRRQILAEVQGKIRDVRSEGTAHKTRVLETGDGSESDIQEDIDFALIQMKAETLSKIDEALSRLEEGAYGYCFECGEEIAERRLRALPFAVRCRTCEEAREIAQRRDRVAGPRTPSSLFFDLPS